MDMTLPVVGITVGAWPVAAAGFAVVAVGSAIYMGVKLKQQRQETKEAVYAMEMRVAEAEANYRDEAKRRQHAEEELVKCMKELMENRIELHQLRTEMADMRKLLGEIKAHLQTPTG